MQSTSVDERKAIYIETRHGKKTGVLKWLDEAMRRALDIVLAGAWLLLLAPTFALIGLAIRLDSPGPVFYRGKRVGRGGKVFGMLKFRTMYGGEKDHNGAKVTAQDDPRITPTGRWLRDNKLNELPQLWNVLVGEMSFVGPRPEDPEIVKGWPEEDKEILLSVRPGVTSPASVVYRDEEQLLSVTSVMEDYLKDIIPTKLRLERLYLRNRSVITDLDVIFWTAITLLPKVRTVTVPQTDLYWGPVARFTFRYLSWMVVDSVIAFLAVMAAGLIWRSSGPLDVGVDKALLYALGTSMVFSLMNWVFGLAHMEWSRAPARNVVKLAISTLLAVTIILVADNAINLPSRLPERMIIFSGMLAFIGFTAMRYRERLITRTGSQWLKARGGVRSLGERVLIVGGGENASLANWIFEHMSMGKAFNVVGIVDDDPRKLGQCIDGHDVLGTTSAIPELIAKEDIGLIVYTIDNIQLQRRAEILSLCCRTGVKVVVLPDILEVMKKGLKEGDKIDHKFEVIMHRAEMDQELGEVEDLLSSKNYEAAQGKLAELRRMIHEKEV